MFTHANNGYCTPSVSVMVVLLKQNGSVDGVDHLAATATSPFPTRRRHREPATTRADPIAHPSTEPTACTARPLQPSPHLAAVGSRPSFLSGGAGQEIESKRVKMGGSVGASVDGQRAGRMRRVGALAGCRGWALVGCGGAGGALAGCGGGVRSPRCGTGGIEDVWRRMWSGGARERDVEGPRAARMRRGGALAVRRRRRDAEVRRR
jgi:hypothetical protein